MRHPQCVIPALGGWHDQERFLPRTLTKNVPISWLQAELKFPVYIVYPVASSSHPPSWPHSHRAVWVHIFFMCFPLPKLGFNEKKNCLLFLLFAKRKCIQTLHCVNEAYKGMCRLSFLCTDWMWILCAHTLTRVDIFQHSVIEPRLPKKRSWPCCPKQPITEQLSFSRAF